MTRVRATDPRPCPKCGKIYRSAHTLRTHLEDKHTVCSGYRCVLCGTVAKSRNSLHSHMSRQHRGISTKDLPVQPMPSNFDPELASNLLLKAGVKVLQFINNKICNFYCCFSSVLYSKIVILELDILNVQQFKNTLIFNYVKLYVKLFYKS